MFASAASTANRTAATLARVVVVVVAPETRRVASSLFVHRAASGSKQLPLLLDGQSSPSPFLRLGPLMTQQQQQHHASSSDPRKYVSSHHHHHHHHHRRFSFSGRKKTTPPGRQVLVDFGPPIEYEDDDDDDVSSGEEGSIIKTNWKERIDVSMKKSKKARRLNHVQLSTVDRTTMEPRCRTVVLRGFLEDVPLDAVRDVLLVGAGTGAIDAGGNGADDDDETEDGDAPPVDDDEGRYDCVMTMTTDSRSNKVRELETFHESDGGGGKDCNTAEMICWFIHGEQYRIRGRLQFIGSDGPLHSYSDAKSSSSNEINDYFIAQRRLLWEKSSDRSREQFYWDEPGMPYPSTWKESNLGVPPGGRDDDGTVLPPPDTFLLMLMYPTMVDYLRLSKGTAKKKKFPGFPNDYRQVDEWDWGDGDDAGECRWKSIRINP